MHVRRTTPSVCAKDQSNPRLLCPLGRHSANQAASYTIGGDIFSTGSCTAHIRRRPARDSSGCAELQENGCLPSNSDLTVLSSLGKGSALVPEISIEEL